MTTYTNMDRQHAPTPKFYQGWLDHKGSKTDWLTYWMVLKGRVVYIFVSQTISADTHIGTLTLDKNTELSLEGGDDRRGYRFQLHTGNAENRRVNKLRTRKKVEREMWRAYIIALSKGVVPGDMDLLPGQIQEVQDNADAYSQSLLTVPPALPPPRPAPGGSPTSARRHRDSGSGESILSGKSGFMSPHSSISGSDNQSGSGSFGSNHIPLRNEGGPTMRHKFHHHDTKEVPSWFFANCSRETAEKILQKAQSYGNTLMRESTTHMMTGSYVISKKVSMGGESKYEHYEVMRVAEGYKMNVENKHAAMKNLSDAMNYFVGTSGSNTHPMSTNNLTLLGLETPNYDFRIPKAVPETGEDEPLPDYEEPVKTTPKTYSPGILKNTPGILKNRSKYAGAEEGAVSQTLSPAYAHDRRGYPNVPMQEIANRVEAAEHIQHLEKTISDFEEPAEEQEYVNEDEMRKLCHRQRPPSPPITLPPPPPHFPSSYVNDGPLKYQRNRSKSVPNVLQPGDIFTPRIIDLDQKVPAGPAPHPPVNILHTSKSTSNTAQPQHQSTPHSRMIHAASWSEGGATEAGTKVPPATAPKPFKRSSQPVGDDEQSERRSVTEITQKFQQEVRTEQPRAEPPRFAGGENSEKHLGFVNRPQVSHLRRKSAPAAEPVLSMTFVEELEQKLKKGATEGNPGCYKNPKPEFKRTISPDWHSEEEYAEIPADAED